MVTDAMVAEALKRFREAGEQTKPCPTCTGKGYHHGFGEHGHDPDWCTECGGAQFVAAFTEEQAMRAALEAAEAAAWEPIETAPNGNVEFDVWAAGKRIPDCHRHLGDILRWASDSVDDEPHWQRVEGVTHWRAAPSPPKDTPHG